MKRHLHAILFVALLIAAPENGLLRLTGQEPEIDFRRTYVPRAEVENVGAGFVPISREKFESTLERVREARSAVGPGQVRLTAAVWIGVFDGESVRGIAQWTPAKTSSSSSDATAVLGTTDLFLDPRFATGDVPAIPASAVPAIEKRGDSAAPSPDENRPRLFLRSDGSLGAEFPQGLPATTAWSARTVATEEGIRTASWRLPQSLRTTLWLVVPEDVQVSADGDWLVERISAGLPGVEAEGENRSFGLFRLLGNPLEDEPLNVRFASVREPKPEDLLYRIANRYVRSSRGLDVEYDLTLDSRLGEFDRLHLLLPPSVTPVEASHDGTPLELVRSDDAASPSASGLVERVVRFAAPVAPSVISLKLRGVVSSGPTGEAPLPQLRIAEATWAGETSTLVAESPLEIQGIVGDGIVPVASPEAGSRSEERYRHRTERSTVAARFSRPPGRATVESVLSLRAGRSSLEASLFAEISAAEGPIFERQLRLLGPWSLDRIEVEPAGALLDWSIDDRRTIRLRFRDGILPGQSVRLGCEAHVRVDDPNAIRSGETLRVFEFVESVQERRAIALFDDAKFRFRPVRIDDWRTLSRTELTAAQRANLGSSAPRALLADDSAFRAMEFVFETEESRLETSSTTSLGRSGSSVAGRIEIECRSLSAPIERLLIAVSSPLPPGSRWSAVRPEDVAFEAHRLVASEAASDGGETWELTFARPLAAPFVVLAAYELPEESSLVAPLASTPTAAIQTGRLSIEADLLEEREVTGVGLERVPATNRSGEPTSVRFLYDPARRHGASLDPASGEGFDAVGLSGPVALHTEVSSAGLHHRATYPVFRSLSAPTKLLVTQPPGVLMEEARAIGVDEEISSAGSREGVVVLDAPSGLRAIEVRYFQPLPSLALWSEQSVALPQIGNLRLDAVEWSVESRGSVAFDVRADGWRAVEDGKLAATESSESEASSGDSEAERSSGDSAFVSLSADRPLALVAYRTDRILQAAWIAFFAVSAFIWALSSRAPAASAVAIATLATALAFLPQPAEALRWGAIYGAAAGLVCSASFLKARFASSSPFAPVERKSGPAAASALVGFALLSTGAVAAFAQEVAQPVSEARTYRVLIPTDDSGQPTGSYYYASREFYDRFLAVERELERPDELWRIVDAVYEGKMSPGVIDGTPRLSQLTLHLEIETYAEDVVATLPLNRRFAEFAGMMEGAVAGGVEAEWNDSGDALSLRFEQAGRRELAIPFYPLADPDLLGGARTAKILPIPWAKLFVAGPAEALDDLSVDGARGAEERRIARENMEIELGPTNELTFGSRRTAGSETDRPAVRWNVGLRVSSDPDDCRIDARIAGEAPLGVLVSRSAVEVGPGWMLETASAPGESFRIEPVATRSRGSRRYEFIFDEPRAGEIAFDFLLLPEVSQEAGLFRTPQLTIDGAPPAAVFAALDASTGTVAEWIPSAPGRVPSAREIPTALEMSEAGDQVRLVPAGESANFAVRDAASRLSYAVQAEFFISPADMSARYEIAVPTGAERWLEFQLPSAIEVSDVFRAQATGRTPLLWRRDDRRLFVKMPAPGSAPDAPAPLVIEAGIRGLGDGSASLQTPTLSGASLGQIDLRVYRRAGLDVSIDAGTGFQVNPTFVPGAFVEGKGRCVGAFLSVKTGAATGTSPAPPLLRSRLAAPASAALWTGVDSQELRQIARFEIEVDSTSGRIDRVALEAPATLGAPQVVSPAGTLSVRESAQADRSYWVFVPTQPLSPDASVILTAPLNSAAAGRAALRPVRLLNVRASDRFVLLPKRMDDQDVTWSVTRLQPARDDDRVRRRIAVQGGDLLAYEATDETFSARAKPAETQAAKPFAVRWTERRVRLEAPGEYRGVVAWDVSPQELSTIEIRMPTGTLPTSLDVDGVPCRWTQSGGVLRASLLPTALPFRLTLAYRGEIAAEVSGEERAELTLTSPALGEGVAQDGSWIVEVASAAPWATAPDGEIGLSLLDYVDARLTAFESTFSATSPRAEGCTAEETRSFAQKRFRDLTELRRLAMLEPNSRKRDETIARVETAMQPYREALIDAAEPQAATAPEFASTEFAANPGEAWFETRHSKRLAIRLGDGTSLSTIDLPATRRTESKPVPWRRMAETSAIVLVCLILAVFGRRLLRWFEQMPLPVGSLAFVALAPFFLPAAWLAPAMALSFLAFGAVAARRWVLPLLPPTRGRGASAP